MDLELDEDEKYMKNWIRIPTKSYWKYANVGKDLYDDPDSDKR